MYQLSDEIERLLNAPIRDKMGAIVTIGQFDNSGDVSAASSAVASYGNLQHTIDGTGVSASYSTWAGNGLRGNARQRILDPDMPFPQAFVSADTSDATGTFSSPPYVEFDFSELRALGGITLTFDNIAKDYPAQITVYSYLNGEIVTQTTFTNMTPVFVAEIFATGVDGIKITFDQTREPNQNVRLSNILFGVGYNFGIDDVMSYTLEESCDPISMQYPSLKFTFSVKNIDVYFSPSLNQNRIQFFARNQTMTAQFWMRDLIRGPSAASAIVMASLGLNTWDVNGIEAKFTTVPLIGRINEMKLSKQQYLAGRSLLDRINDIKADIGINDAIYADGDADDITCDIPFDNGTPASEAIQLLANYGGYCLIYSRLTGALLLGRRRSTSDFSIYSASQAPTGYSRLTDIGQEATSEYATWERNFFRGDGTQLILPDTGPYSNNGFVSAGVVTDGTETLEIVYDAGSGQGQMLNSLTVDFGGVVPEILEVWQNSAPSGQTAQWSINATLHPAKSKQSFGASIGGALQYKMIFKNGPNNTMLGRRYYVRNVTSSFVENFTFSRGKIFYPTKFVSKVNYGSISTVFRDVAYGNTLEELGTLKVSGAGTYSIPIERSMVFSATYTGGNGSESVTNYSFYLDYIQFTVVSMGTVTGDLEFTITGKKINYTQTMQSRVINPTGIDYSFENPLYDSSSVDRVMDYTAAYAQEQLIEEIECMAHPELEIGDYITLYDGTIGFIAKRVMKNGRDKFTIMRGYA